eukprot:CAMPEP_0175060638 /NCGR_PEP_ID=MMETSP0052_2-20121109/13135_1 /TAXON_ID=51329 ORGANISM="Polytomella parva, Strain SAG 63-3" /NCGR_SAMPLE_ID=MMETSP0052_2 /ASSEMBLY_ACC=CAM_ASM_000194 /LENGTH=42 /DNA_ID= /DNA_START= /DNA_END= /DNA_ORIENTATION=
MTPPAVLLTSPYAPEGVCTYNCMVCVTDEEDEEEEEEEEEEE